MTFPLKSRVLSDRWQQRHAAWWSCEGWLSANGLWTDSCGFGSEAKRSPDSRKYRCAVIGDIFRTAGPFQAFRGEMLKISAESHHRTVQDAYFFFSFPSFIFSTFSRTFFEGQNVKFAQIHLTWFPCVCFCFITTLLKSLLIAHFNIHKWLIYFLFLQRRQKLRYPGLTINHSMLIWCIGCVGARVQASYFFADSPAAVNVYWFSFFDILRAFVAAP